MQTFWPVPPMSGSSLQHIHTKGLHANPLAGSIHVRFKSPTYTNQGATCKPSGQFHPCQVQVSNIYTPRGYMQTLWLVPSMSGSSLQHIQTKGLHANLLASSIHVRFKSPTYTHQGATCKPFGWFHPHQVQVQHAQSEVLCGTNLLDGSIHVRFQFDMYILRCYLAQTFWLVPSMPGSSLTCTY